MESYELYDRNTQAIIYGMHVKPIQRMLDFDYMIKREKPSVAGIVDPGKSGFHKAFFGTKEILIAVYPDTKSACSKHNCASVFINFASMRSAYSSSLEAINCEQFTVIAIIAEGIPERRTRELIAIAKEKNKVIIGPATVGGIKAGAFRIGDTAGSLESIIDSKLYRPGSVGFVSKSGGMSNELYNVIAMKADGIYEGLAIGGDMYPGSQLLDHVMRFETNPAIKMIVVLGEIGGNEEYRIAEALKNGQIKKPLVIWVTGTCASVFPGEVQFGHAGAASSDKDNSAQAKNAALRVAGANVPNSFDDFGDLIGKIFNDLKEKGVIGDIAEVSINEVPEDYEVLRKAGKVRKSANFICTISDDRGEEATYCGVPISETVEGDYSLTDVICLLWFKKKLPKEASKFLEMVLKNVADHGPAVSGVHNAVVAARAGKDLMSCLASGILTIGPRFGAAIADSARFFKDAIDRGLRPMDFVSEMKKKGINIPGIGHKVKSIHNPDERVASLKKYAFSNFTSHKHLSYALEVEKITVQKKANLIFNVDGCIAMCFLDLMESYDFTEKEIQDVLDAEVLNGLFVLGRSIGIMGHIFDQKRLGESLYRHPTDDILFL